MKKIDGKSKSVRDLLKGKKYAIDYYQREFNWEEKQVSELVEDLIAKFSENYEDTHKRPEVKNYGHYFLGSIIISEKNNQCFIVDGQQRLTTLTLFLIYLNNLQQEHDVKVPVDEMIYSEQFGSRSFNLDVDERKRCMEALFKEGTFDDAKEKNPSVQNIAARFKNFDELQLFPSDLRGKALPFFIDWLIEKVYLVEITASSDDDAYTIFETMNDRGLSLTPTDMLKGFLLANITDEERRNRASDLWKERIRALTDLGLGKEEGADCLKAWLRSQFADGIRERKKDAEPEDFDRIGTEFHRWVREHQKNLGLSESSEFFRFIKEDFVFYSHWYATVRKAADKLTQGLEPVFYNAQHNFTLQYPLLLAPLEPSDDEDTIMRKIRVVAHFIDILITRRIWNFDSINYSTMQYAMFRVVQGIRRLGLEDLAATLKKRLESKEDEVSAFENKDFHLHGRNGKQIHHLLARMTDYVEMKSGQPGQQSRYPEYSVRGRGGYEIEHIWADHPERHEDEFEHSSAFSDHRNRFGGLLLLPKTSNASYSDLPYEEKRQHYLKENLLACSLHELCYERKPGFKKFVAKSGIPFKACPVFKRSELDERSELYRRLAEMIWSSERLEREIKA